LNLPTQPGSWLAARKGKEIFESDSEFTAHPWGKLMLADRGDENPTGFTHEGSRLRGAIEPFRTHASTSQATRPIANERVELLLDGLVSLAARLEQLRSLPVGGHGRETPFEIS